MSRLTADVLAASKTLVATERVLEALDQVKKDGGVLKVWYDECESETAEVLTEAAQALRDAIFQKANQILETRIRDAASSLQTLSRQLTMTVQERP